MIGILANSSTLFPPFGKQTYFFEEMLSTLSFKASCLFVFLDPKDADGKQQIFLQGYVYNTGTNSWESLKDITFPTIIYDRYFSGSENDYMLYTGVKKDLQNFGSSIYNNSNILTFSQDKYMFYNFLQKNGYPTPSTKLITDVQDLHEIHLEYPTGNYYLKPRYGSKGYGISIINKTKNSLTLRENETRYSGKDEIGGYMKSQLAERLYILQPAIIGPPLHTCAFDIRVLLHKYDGNTIISGLAVRVTKPGEYRSNLHQGGVAQSLELFFTDLSPKDRTIIKNSIYTLCSRLSHDITTQIGEFLELGIDLLLDEKYEIHVLEINAKPSRWIFRSIAESTNEQEAIKSLYTEIRQESVQLPARELMRKIHVNF